MTQRLPVNLQVSPAEGRAIATAARKAGVSKRVWITQLVRDRIDQADDTSRIEAMIDRLDTETRARTASTTEQTLSVIRAEAQSLTEQVVAAMQQAAPKTPTPTTKIKGADWGGLITALGKLSIDVDTNLRANKDRVASAKTIAAACNEEAKNFERPINLVRTQFLILEKTARTKQVEDPELQDLFDLIRQFIPTTPRSHL